MRKLFLVFAVLFCFSALNATTVIKGGPGEDDEVLDDGCPNIFTRLRMG